MFARQELSAARPAGASQAPEYAAACSISHRADSRAWSEVDQKPSGGAAQSTSSQGQHRIAWGVSCRCEGRPGGWKSLFGCLAAFQHLDHRAIPALVQQALEGPILEVGFRERLPALPEFQFDLALRAARANVRSEPIDARGVQRS